MNEMLDLVARAQKEKTPFCNRYIEFLRSGLGRSTMDLVLFNIVAWQEGKGELRTDRQFEYYSKPMTRKAFENNEEAIIANKSDAKILSELGEFKEAHSLDMSSLGERWFVYVTEGGDWPEAAQRDPDVPF